MMFRPTRQPFLLLILFFYTPFFCFSQADSLQRLDLEAVTISASRVAEKAIVLPLSVTKLRFRSSQDVRQQLSLQEYLTEVPGLFSMNANNFAQDLRVSIRGFGARSAFGIRGIKILVDGIPETTPDGQGQIDNLNLGIIDNIEVIRGPSSALYGNASGGVISINTVGYFGKNFLQGSTTFGAFNLQKYQLTGGLISGKTRLVLNGSHTATDGYRDHSGFKSTNLNARAIHRMSSKSTLLFQANYTDSPKADDAGGLDLLAVQTDRRQARDRNLQFDAGESVRHVKFGAAFKYDFDEDNHFSTYAFLAKRSFNGNLPFETGGIIDLDRSYAGLGSSYQQESSLGNGENILKIGYEMAGMGDMRLRFDNLLGEKGPLALDQLESFNSFGGYAIDHLTVGKWLVTGGLRFDYNQLIVNDHFTANGNSSSEKVYKKYNPSISFSYSLSSQHFVFAGFSTSFETPVLSELSANPNGGDGFNRELVPQTARNFELGFKTRNKMGDQQLEISLFHIATENDLVPFELDSLFPGRTFYRNAGSGQRNGLEVEFFKSISQHLRVAASYTYSDFTYKKYETPGGDFAGKDLPGIPKHTATASLAYRDKKLIARLQGRFSGDVYADDANATAEAAYLVVNLNIGYKIVKGKWLVTPFFGINNLFNASYTDNLRLNAFGGRYFEPAPGLNVFGGIRAKI